jgi:hypothetical protein
VDRVCSKAMVSKSTSSRDAKGQDYTLPFYTILTQMETKNDFIPLKLLNGK